MFNFSFKLIINWSFPGELYTKKGDVMHLDPKPGLGFSPLFFSLLLSFLLPLLLFPFHSAPTFPLFIVTMQTKYTKNNNSIVLQTYESDCLPSTFQYYIMPPNITDTSEKSE